MITIQEVKITDFGPIEKFHYRFASTSGTFAIRGKNGAGKSHLVGALQAAVTNSIMPEKPRGALVRNYGINGEVAKIEVTCDVNGQPFTVSRSISTKRGEDIAGKLAEGGYPDAVTKHRAEYGEQKCTKAAEVETLVSDVFGLTNPVQVSSVFVLQNMAGALLRGSAAERAAAFQFLSGADVLAETNRYAEKRVKQFSLTDYAEDIALAQDELDKLAKQLDSTMEEMSTCGERIDTGRIRMLHDELSAIQAARRAADKQARTIADVDKSVQRARELRTAIDTVMAEVTALGIDPQLAKNELSRIEGWRKVERVYHQWCNAEFAIQQMNEGQHPKPLEELENALNALRRREHEIQARQSELGAGLKKFQKDGKCPTCGSGGKCPECGFVFNEFQASIAAWQQENALLEQERQVLSPRIAKGVEVVGHAKKFWDELDRRTQNADQAHREVEALFIEGLAQNWADITNTVIPALRAYEEQWKAYQPLTLKEKSLRREMDQVLATIDALKKNQEPVPDTDVRPEREQALREELEAATNVANTRGRLEGTIKSLELRREEVAARLRSLRDRQDAGAKTKRVVDYLQGIRAATNPGAIPKDRATAYIDRLNKYLGFYCRELQMPFNLTVDPGYQEMMVHLDDYLLPARHRLSEGQKTMAAWVWHLSLYAMHGSRVGFIVLDEPTTGLDADNRQRVADAIQSLTKFCHNTGLQLLLVTHDIDLASVFGSTIEV